MEILFSNDGTPLVLRGSKFFGSTITGTKSIKEKSDDKFTFSGKEYISWGTENKYPDEAESIIEKTSVLKTGLNYKCRCCYGQGVVPVKVEGFDKNNSEIFTPISDKEILSYLRGFPFRNYHTSAFRDLIKFGNCFPILVFNNAGDKIVRVQIENARHCRMSLDKTKLLVFGDFANNSPGDPKYVALYDMLDEQDPMYDLMFRKDIGKLKESAIAFPR